MRVLKLKNKIVSITAAIILLFALTCNAYATDRYVIPSGNTVGIQLETNGIIVSGIGSVCTNDGEKHPAYDAGLRAGDVITRIGRTKISSATDLRSVMCKNKGEALAVQVNRNGNIQQYTLYPAKNTEGNYELGIFFRDGIAGIGTITYYDPENGDFGALGHAITDIDTGILMPIRSGKITHSEVTGIIKGARGTPGELIGSIENGDVIGSVSCNTWKGIFGNLNTLDGLNKENLIELASKEEVRTGKACIWSNICGDSVSEYEIEITKVYEGDTGDGRGMMIHVTDSSLLELTGGIVQGMSGSPILQDGKLVGAVTHVLVNDPTRGYGIFIENMLEAAE